MKRITCSSCNGEGLVTVFDGIAALAEKYPGLPVREMANRGWFGDIRDDDEPGCDAAFLKFWNAGSHEEVAAILSGDIRRNLGMVCSGIASEYERDAA